MDACLVPGCPRSLYARGYCNAHYIAHRKHPDDTPAELAARSERAQRARTDDEMRDLLRRRVVVTATGCHEWQGARDRREYGNVRWAGRLWGAHRLTYHLFVAPVDPALEVCHSCDNPPCCNPAHLFQGTHHENMLDAAEKGIMAGNGNRSGSRNGRAVFTADQIREIRASPERGVDLAARFGVHFQTISDIRCRRRYRDVA